MCVCLFLHAYMQACIRTYIHTQRQQRKVMIHSERQARGRIDRDGDRCLDGHIYKHTRICMYVYIRVIYIYIERERERVREREKSSFYPQFERQDKWNIWHAPLCLDHAWCFTADVWNVYTNIWKTEVFRGFLFFYYFVELFGFYRDLSEWCLSLTGDV